MILQEHVQSFLMALAEWSRSPNTVKTYRTALAHWLQFNPRPVKQWRVEHVRAFARYLRQAAFSPSTRETYLFVVGRFVRFLIARGILPWESAEQTALAEFLQAAHERRQPLPRALPDDVVGRLLEALDIPPPGPEPRTPAERRRRQLIQARNRAIVYTLLETGMRVGELVRLTRGDLDHRQRCARVLGKGQKERLVFFGADSWQALQRYLALRADGEIKRSLADQPLFARHDRRAGKQSLRPLTPQRVEQIFAQLVARANLEVTFPVTPHTLRHTFATKLLNKSGDLAAVQDLLGHASASTTRRYAAVSVARLRQVHHMVFGDKGGNT